MPEGWSGMGMFGLRPLNVNRLVVKKENTLDKEKMSLVR